MFHLQARRSMIEFVVAVALAVSASLPSFASEIHGFEISAKDASSAIRDFGSQARVQILVAGEHVRGKQLHPVSGEFSTDEGLKILLADSGLTAQYVGDRSIALVPAEAANTGAAASGETLALEEVIVTATKRPEAVRKISGSVSAFTGVELEKLGAQSMSDYLTRTPGVVFNGNTPGNSTVTIRGISTTTRIDQGQATTGYFLDDVPLTDPFFSIAIPDIDAFDVDNVAILRGPQGTLFGSASLGGAINYQTAKPDSSRWDMRVQGTFADVADGGSSEAGKVMVNMPLISDTLAVRGVYVYRDDAGFIDNVGTGKRDADGSKVRGGRIQALWTPTADTRVNYLFLNQTQDNDDNGYQAPQLAGALRKDTVVPEFSEFETLIHNLRLDQTFAFGTVTASAAYHEKTADSVDDVTPDLAGLLPGVSPITIGAPATSRGKTFELRLASPTGRRFEYLIGAMRDDTRMNIVNLAYGLGAAQAIEDIFGPILGEGIGALSAPGDVFLAARIPVRGEETALFGEATYHFNEQWKATLGGRAFDTKVENATISSGFFTLLTTGALEGRQSGTQSESGFTPKASITWTPNEDFMTYALVSKGFRYGGPNIVASEPGFAVPPRFNSDSLINYELGMRTDLFDRRLQLDGTVFYIDWSDVQLRQQTALQLNYAANAGKAESYGFEGAATALLTSNLMFSTSVTYLNAELAEDFNPGGGGDIVLKGSTLPGASEWQVANTLSYDWRGGPLEPSFVLAHRYVSEAPGIFGSGAEQGDYNLLDARLSFHINQFGITAFVNNLADSRGVTTASEAPLRQFLVRPRTIGITLDYRL